VQRYTVALAAATRRTPELSLGASPRASLHLVRAAKATAAVQGRDFVLPDDVLSLAPWVLTHRLLPSVEAAMGGRTTATILESILNTVPVPEGTRA
jgi:MoxR-like ATPase